MSGVIRSVLLLLLPAMALSKLVPDLIYSCNPSGTITVDNPDTVKYRSATAVTVDGTQNCTTTFLFFYKTILISGCSISRNISLWFFDGPTEPEIITDQAVFYTIRCQQIPATGIYRRVTDESWVTNYVSTSILPSVTPRIILDTEIQDIESGFQRTRAQIGELLRWEIDGPVNYYVLPLNCSAVAGDFAYQCPIVLDGCSQDLSLLGHFSREVDNPHIIFADLFAFRFASSTRILFICEMLGCNNQSSACDINCPGDRKRRDIADEENIGEARQDQNIIFRREVMLEGGRVVRDAGNSESHPWSHHPERDEREAGSGEQGGEIFGEIRTSLQISDPVMAKPWAQLLDRGSATVPVTSAVLMTLAALASLML